MFEIKKNIYEKEYTDSFMPGLSIYIHVHYIHVYLQVLYKVMLQLRNSSSYGDDLRLYSSGLSREDTSILNTTG